MIYLASHALFACPRVQLGVVNMIYKEEEEENDVQRRRRE